MKPFNSKVVCPKCGYPSVHVHHCYGEPHAPDWIKSYCARNQKGEHLHRRCERCNYEWLEACLKGAAES